LLYLNRFATIQRFRPRFFAVLQQQRTAGNRKYTEKSAKEPYTGRNQNVTLPPTKILAEPQGTAAVRCALFFYIVLFVGVYAAFCGVINGNK